MQYLCYSDAFGWDYRRYEEYLGLVRGELPDDLLNLLGEDRLLIDGAGTLHDSYLLACGVRFSPVTIAAASTGRSMSMHLELVGRFEDRVFRLDYVDVTSQTCDRSWPELHELDAHELLILPDGCYRHEIQFRNASFVVVCSRIHFNELLLTRL